LDQIALRLADATIVISYHGKNMPSVAISDYPKYLHICESAISSGKISLIHLPKNNQPPNFSHAKIGVIRLVNFESRDDSNSEPPTTLVEFKSNDLLLKSLIANRIDGLLSDPIIVKALHQNLSPSLPPLVSQPTGQYSLHLAIHKHWQKNSKLKQKLCQEVSKNTTIKQSNSIKQAIVSSLPSPQ